MPVPHKHKRRRALAHSEEKISAGLQNSPLFPVELSRRSRKHAAYNPEQGESEQAEVSHVVLTIIVRCLSSFLSV